MPDLYVVYLGGSLSADRMGEDHQTVVVVADDVRGARRSARAKWGGDGRAHVDAVLKVSAVDGYRVAVEQTGEPDRLELDPEYEPAPDDPED